MRATQSVPFINKLGGCRAKTVRGFVTRSLPQANNPGGAKRRCYAAHVIRGARPVELAHRSQLPSASRHTLAFCNVADVGRHLIS